MILRYLIEKEFKQLIRNSFLPRLILIFPCMIMLVMPWAATLEIEDLRIAIIDNDHTPSSLRLTHRIESSPYFKLVALPDTYHKAVECIERNQADMLLEIPKGFEKEQVNGRPASALVAINAVNGTKGGLGNTYLQQILNPQSTSVASIRYRFNPHLDYKTFMVPALMTMLLVMLCGFLPALNVVGEKEAGTIEQINVTPVSRFTFTLSKLLPYWLIGFIVLNLCMLLAWAVYGLTPVGSIFTIYLATLIFVLVMSGLGLVISNYSSTMQQAMFVMWFCMLIFILMSGLFTPISSMPDWAQYITYINPLRYFMEMMRMVNSGTEAVMSAIRAARGYTGRDYIVKFEGCYHGHSDGLLVKAGSGLLTENVPDSAGVPKAFTDTTLIARYNDLESVQRLFDQYGEKIAALIVEPVAANMGVVPPQEGFLRFLRDITLKYNSLLIFDEVITGFRLSIGGAQKYYNVKPDLTTLGKIVGGGMPLAVYGGKKEVMQCVAPLGSVYQAGTLSGNPVAVSAGIETLKILEENEAEIYTRLEKISLQLENAMQESGMNVNRVGSIMTVFFTNEKVKDYDTAKTADTARFAEYFRHMQDNGIYTAPSQFEAMFVSFAHTDEDIDKTINAIKSLE